MSTKYQRSTTASRRAAKKPTKFLHVSARLGQIDTGTGLRTVVLKGATYSAGRRASKDARAAAKATRRAQLLDARI